MDLRLIGAIIHADHAPKRHLSQQKRIVAQVHALMKLCDEQKARLKAREETASRRVEAVVKELLA